MHLFGSTDSGHASKVKSYLHLSNTAHRNVVSATALRPVRGAGPRRNRRVEGW
jgi:hypothetical protein